MQHMHLTLTLTLRPILLSILTLTLTLMIVWQVAMDLEAIQSALNTIQLAKPPAAPSAVQFSCRFYTFCVI